MFAWNVEGIEPGLGNGLIGVIELFRFGQMGDVAGVNHEGGLLRQCSDLGNGLVERRHRIGVRRRLKTDMAVGNLQECETGCGLRLGFGNSQQRR
jgi:hypothetical protein